MARLCVAVDPGPAITCACKNAITKLELKVVLRETGSKLRFPDVFDDRFHEE